LFLISLDLCSRPSTPIEEVLQHSYADKWLESMQNKQGNIKQEKPDTTVKKTLIVNLHVYFIFIFD